MKSYFVGTKVSFYSLVSVKDPQSLLLAVSGDSTSGQETRESLQTASLQKWVKVWGQVWEGYFLKAKYGAQSLSNSKLFTII